MVTRWGNKGCTDEGRTASHSSVEASHMVSSKPKSQSVFLKLSELSVKLYSNSVL